MQLRDNSLGALRRNVYFARIEGEELMLDEITRRGICFKHFVVGEAVPKFGSVLFFT